MASLFQVKTYLAQWFQLGKKAVSHDRGTTYFAERVFFGETYSADFERCWRQVLAAQDDVFLDGTDQNIAALLGGEWEIQTCARCQMPVPTSKYHWLCGMCPCSDMTTWPNEHLPKPRGVPAQTQMRLQALCMRLEEHEECDRVS